MHLDAIRDLLHARAFAMGLAFGGVGVFVSSLAAISRRRVPDLGGMAFVLAAWLAVRGAWGQSLASTGVLVALGCLAAGGALVVVITRNVAATAAHPLLVTAIALVPGALLLAHATPLAGSTLSRGVLAAGAVAFGVLTRDFDAMRGRKGAPWLLWAVTFGGVYLAVPDTELARVALGVAVPFVLLSIPKPVTSLGPGGSTALAGFFVWVVVVGGRGRPGSVVGGFATLGLLFAEPVGRRLLGSWNWSSGRSRMHLHAFDGNRDEWLVTALFAALVQFVIALYASRVVARADAAVVAFTMLVPVLIGSVIVAPLLYEDERERNRRLFSRASRPARRVRPARR